MKLDVGMKLGGVELLRRLPKEKGDRHLFWECRCLSCGKVFRRRSDKIANGRGCRSCGNSLTIQPGDVFGRLTAIRFAEHKSGVAWWVFRCSCGSETIKPVHRVVSGVIQSCGCLQKEAAAQLGREFSERSEQVVDGTYLPRLRENSVTERTASGYRGVYFNTQRGKWVAQIYFQKKQIVLGAFDNPRDASAAYQAAKARLHGEELEKYGQKINEKKPGD